MYMHIKQGKESKAKAMYMHMYMPISDYDLEEVFLEEIYFAHSLSQALYLSLLAHYPCS